MLTTVKKHKIRIFNGELLCKRNLKLQKLLWICERSFVNSHPVCLAPLYSSSENMKKF